MSALKHVTLAEIEPADDNLRRNLTGIDELAASIAAQGIITPLTLTPNGGEKLKIVAGNRRYAAVAKLIETGVVSDTFPIPAQVYDQLGDAERIEQMVVENIQREDLNPIEEAAGYKRLVDEFGYSQRQIAERVGRNQSHVSKRLLLLGLPEAVQGLVVKGRLEVETAQLMARLEDHDLILALLDRHGNEVTENQVRNAIEGQKAEKALATLVEKATAAGLPVTTRVELTSNYGMIGEHFATVKEAQAFVKSEAWVAGADDGDDGMWFVGNVQSLKPVLSVYAPKGKRSPAEKDDPQKRAAKLERITTKLETEAIVGAIDRFRTKSVLVDLLLVTFLDHEVTHSNAGQVVKYLNLEPLTKQERVTNYETGEVGTKTVKDYVGTVRNYGEQGPKELVKAVAAAVVVRYGHDDRVRQFLADLGVEDRKVYQAQAEEQL